MAGMTVQMVLTQEQMEQIARMIADALPPRPIDRHAAMVERLGEACTQQQACEALNVSRPTLYRMLHDGRLRQTTDGLRVDVRSMAEYIEGKNKRRL